MTLNFKKISAVLGSLVLTGMTMGVAAAAAFPAGFTSSTPAIVYGTGTGAQDQVPATSISTYLTGKVPSGIDENVNGEFANLFTGGTKIYINDSINTVKTVLTKSDLPTILVDGTFSGNVEATYTQKIDIGANPIVTFAKQPTSSDDPEYGLTIPSTSSSQYIYNATVTFNKAVALNDTDSEGESLELFGQKFTIGSSTDATNLVLLQSAEKVTLTSDANPSQEVTVGGKTYTVELVSSSDTAATIKVTDSSGASESKEINEAATKKVNGLTIAVVNADETNLKLSASIVAGSEKVTFTDGSTVTVGEDDTVIDGTSVQFGAGEGVNNLTTLSVSVVAENSDEDALKSGEYLLDPVFKTFKLNFAGLSILAEDTLRETIEVAPSGDDKMEVKFTDYNGKEATIQYVMNATTDKKLYLQHDSDGRNISVVEKNNVYRNEYIVVGNEDEGHLLKVSTITNQTSGYSNDKVVLSDVITEDTYTATITGEGVGSVIIGGKSYELVYHGAQSISDDAKYINLNYPDSSGNNLILYPSIQTSKGAKLMFYTPVTITNLYGFGGATSYTANISGVMLPNGDGYDTTSIAAETANNTAIDFTLTGGSLNTGATVGADSVKETVGKLYYNFTTTGTTNQTKIYLLNPQGGNIVDPAIIILEEKDDNTEYHAIVVATEAGGNSEDGIGVDDVIRSWSNDAQWDAISLASDSKKTKEADLWGSIITVDNSDSDQSSASISYPDEQLYANIYIAESGASSSSGNMIFKDSEKTSWQNKNVIIVGGSCINSAAAEALFGSTAPVCEAAFTAGTGVQAGQFLIQSIGDKFASGKIALVVAGYDASDTVAAVQRLVNQPGTIDTTAGKKYLGVVGSEGSSVVSEI